MAILVDILASGVVDSTGDPLASGVAYVYEVGTTTPANVYQDVDLTIPGSNPITLDSAGKAELYVDSAVRLVIEDSSGTQVDDIDSYGGEKTEPANLIVSNDLTVNGDASIGDDLTVTDDLTVSGDTSITGSIKGGLIEYAGALTSGWVSNLGLSLSSGTLSIVDAGGTALSTSNPGFVTAPGTTAGTTVSLKVNAGGSFNDDAHASSDLTNLGFGITEAADWQEDAPFFIYVANRADNDISGTDGDSCFFITRAFSMHTTPSSADDIGDTAALPTNDSQDVILLLGDYTVANYVSLPCQLVGAFRMQWLAANTDWTVQTLSNVDGFGQAQLDKAFATEYTMPTGQNGAATGGHMLTNGGTAPTFTSNIHAYTIAKDGTTISRIYLAGDGGTDGSGSVISFISLPYVTASSPNNPLINGSCWVRYPSEDYVAQPIADVGESYFHVQRQTSSGANVQDQITNVQHGDFTNGDRRISTMVMNKVY